MATVYSDTTHSMSFEAVPPLCAGDHLTRAEFERRYTAMPEVKKAELIEGVVYMPSPVSQTKHAGPHFNIITWLGAYCAVTPGIEGGDNATVRLDLENEPQPDALLRIQPNRGGQSRTRDEFIEGPPELVVEVAASSASYDLHEKLRAYQRNSVREYLVWRVSDRTIDWFALVDDRYQPMPLSPDGFYQSKVFPGLWLDAAALVRGDLAQVMRVLQQGTNSPEHAEFVRLLSASQGTDVRKS